MMIHGTLKNWEKEKGCFPPAFATALAFLSEKDLTGLAVGKHPIQGDQICALVQDIVTKPAQLQRFELHRQYIDIHFILSGREKQLYAPKQENLTLLQDDLETKDIAFCTSPEKYHEIILDPGDYIVYLAGELHCPCCAVEQDAAVKKIVFKIHSQCITPC